MWMATGRIRMGFDGLFLVTPLVFDPLKNDAWKLEDDPFLLGFGNFSGASC